MATQITLDLDTATVSFNSGGAVQTQKLAIPESMLRSTEFRAAIPSMDKIATTVSQNSEATGQLVADYIEGRMDAVTGSAVRLGLVDSSLTTRTLVPGETPEAALVAIIVIIVIIIILLFFPKVVHAPTKQPTRN